MAQDRVPYAVESVTLLDASGEATDNPDLAGHAADDDAQTAWVSARYDEATFDETKDGIGLVFDLGQEHEIRNVQIQLVRGGLDVQLYAAETLPPAAEGPTGWGEVRWAQTDILSSQPVALNPTVARYWLLWIHGLSPSSTGEFTAEVAEVAFFGPS